MNPPVVDSMMPAPLKAFCSMACRANAVNANVSMAVMIVRFMLVYLPQ
jgi:hypothetical protein